MRRSPLRLLYRAVFFVLIVAAGRSHALEADFRVKWFTTASVLPSHDVQRQLIDTPSVDSTGDLRMMFRHDAGPVRFILDHSTIVQTGDAVFLQRGPDSAVDQTVINDDRRWVDLTWRLEDGPHHQTVHRIDRLALQIQTGNWGITFGRQAVSWGSGIVFQPMDPFNPFSPTVVDRDYKAGNDLLLVDRLLDNGHDLQLLYVVRRDDDYHVTREVASAALKWHGYMGNTECELVGAKHYDEGFFGGSLRFPVGNALVRTDVVGMDIDGDWRVSGLINADYSFVVADRNSYVFAEYFYNDLGVSELPDNPLMLPPELLARLERGELFNLMQDYLALGATLEWHPLVSQALTFIGNLNDSSILMQTSVSYSPSDHQILQAGWVEPLGGRGDEFGGVPVAGDSLTTGGASRVFLRWVYYFN